VPQYTLEHYEGEFGDRHFLHGVVTKWAKERPDTVALKIVDTGETYTYKEFDEITTALAVHLVEMGYQKGDFVATMLPLLAEHIFLEYACFKIGAIHAPLDLRLKVDEVIRSLGLIQAKAFVFQGKTPIADFSPLGVAVKEHCPFVEKFIQFAPPNETVAGAISAEDLAQKVERLLENPSRSDGWQRYQEMTQSVKESDGVQVIYTTGSTGLPKPALLTHRNITSQNMCLGGGFDMTHGARMLVHLPPSHVGCQGEQLMTTLFWGGTAIVMHLFDAEKTLRAVQEHQVEVLGQIPAMYAMQWALPNYKDYDLSSLQLALHGGQQVTQEFLVQLSSMAPKVCTGLGLTEMAGFVTYTPLDASLEEIVDNVGYDMPITHLTIRKPMKSDGSAGEKLPEGQVGEICFAGPQVFAAYVNNDEAYRKTVSEEGICYTGDLGFVDDSGLHFSGRSKLVLKPKGYQVHPAQIESHFTKLADKIVNAAAVGVPHKIFSEAVVLFVEKRKETQLTLEELEAHAKNIASYMRPSHYVIFDQGQLPLNRVAKTDYVLLKKKAKQEVEALKQEGQWD